MKRLPLAAIALSAAGQALCGEPADEAFARFKLCFQWDGAARVECLDRLARDLYGPSSPTAAPADGGNWVISETTSPLDYSPQITAAIPSEPAVKDAPSSFAIRCRGQRTELLVSTLGSWRPSNRGEFKVAYRINDQPAVEDRWVSFAGGRSAVFKGDVVGLLRSLPEGGQISIRVYDWQGPAHDATFQIAGVDAVRQRIAAACKWQ